MGSEDVLSACPFNLLEICIFLTVHYRKSDINAMAGISKKDDESGLQGGCNTGLNVDTSSDADDPSVVDSEVSQMDVRVVSEGGVDARHDSEMDVGEDDDADDSNFVVESSASGGCGGRARPAVRHRVVEKRGRSCGTHNWAQTVAKKKRNLGKEYVSSRTHRVVQKREIGPACKDVCFPEVGLEKIKEIFSVFWDIGNYDKQNAHLISLICTEEPKRKRGKNIRKARVNYTYTIKYKTETHVICKHAFLSIHGIKKKKLSVLLAKKANSVTGTPESDQRGKRPNVRKIQGDQLKRVHEHIQCLPTYSSHATRPRVPHRKYLEVGGSIKGLHEQYCVWMQDNYVGEPIVSERFYHKVFTEDYNIVCESPKQDTCTTCECVCVFFIITVVVFIITVVLRTLFAIIEIRKN